MGITNRDQAKEIVRDLLAKASNRISQELSGENEELLPRVLRQYRSKIARKSWFASQKWAKWNNEGPVLMPDFTRIYYRKGNTEVLVQEFPPQVRLSKFKGGLVFRSHSMDDSINKAQLDKVYQFSLAFPYTVFLFRFMNGLFVDVHCTFNDRPLKRLEERPLRPYLPNLDSNLKLCLGTSFRINELEKDNVAQQSALVLSHFWQSVYSEDWPGHYWNCKEHFQRCDKRLATLDAWQAASIDNPLFVLEDVSWLQHSENSYGDMIVKLFAENVENNGFTEELYSELSEAFIEEVKKTFIGNTTTVMGKVTDAMVDQLADELWNKVQ